MSSPVRSGSGLLGSACYYYAERLGFGEARRQEPGENARTPHQKTRVSVRQPGR